MVLRKLTKKKLTYKIGNINYQNGQKYSECQLVSALNASYHLGEKFIDPDSDEYERLVDFTGARYGSCISIESAYQYLRLRYVDVKPEFKSIFFAIKSGFPIGVGIHHIGTYGFHNTLVIGMEFNDKRGSYNLRVPNFTKFTDKDMWIHWYDYKELIRVAENICPERGFFRVFYIDPLYRKGENCEYSTYTSNDSK